MSFFHYSQINCINEVRNFLLLIVYLKIFGIQKKGGDRVVTSVKRYVVQLGWGKSC